MKAVLERLFTLRGIRAACAFDKNGALLCSHGDDMVASIERMSSMFQQTFSTATSFFASNATSTIVHFEGGTLVVRRNADVMLVVVGDSTFDATERGSAVTLGVALVALRLSSRRPPRTASGTLQAPSQQPAELVPGDLRPPKAPAV